LSINNTKFFKIDDLKSWIHKKSQPNNYLFIGKNPIEAELLKIIDKEPIEKYDKSEKVFQFLDSFFDSVQWTNTFSLPHVIYYDEFIIPEIIFYFHRYLSKICLDIENIYIIVSQSHGIFSWWEDYKKIMQIKSFSFIEIGYTYCINFFWLSNFKNIINYIENIDIEKEKNILHTFSFYGGTYYTECRNFLFLLFNYFGDNNPVDKIFDITDKKSTLNYCEQITNFKNQEIINFIEERWNNDRDCYNLITEKKRKYKEHLQFNIDKNCFANVVRETGQEFPWSVITEKTLRCFLNYTIPLPLGYMSVDHIKKYGFWLPDDLIDYSYQYEPFFIDRCIKIFKIIEKLESIKKCELNHYFFDNIKNFDHNFQIVKEMVKTNKNFYT
jgi:hypothetical protein